jgi:hypothetical protein
MSWTLQSVCIRFVCIRFAAHAYGTPTRPHTLRLLVMLRSQCEEAAVLELAAQCTLSAVHKTHHFISVPRAGPSETANVMN